MGVGGTRNLEGQARPREAAGIFFAPNVELKWLDRGRTG